MSRKSVLNLSHVLATGQTLKAAGHAVEVGAWSAALWPTLLLLVMWTDHRRTLTDLKLRFVALAHVGEHVQPGSTAKQQHSLSTSPTAGHDSPERAAHTQESWRGEQSSVTALMGAAGRRSSPGVLETRPAALHRALTGQVGVPPLGFEGKT